MQRWNALEREESTYACKEVLPLCLALALSLAACGAPTAEVSPAPEHSPGRRYSHPCAHPHTGTGIYRAADPLTGLPLQEEMRTAGRWPSCSTT